MGLSNWKKIDNLFDLGFQKRYLVSGKFGFELGKNELN